MSIGRLAEIRRYPVKSMAGESLSDVELGTGGLPGDRAWAIRDEESGGICGAKKFAGLMGMQARYEKPPASRGSSPAEIRLTDGARLTTGDAQINDRLSKALDHRVSLWPLLPAEDLDHYRRVLGDPANFEADLRAMFARTPDEPLPDLGAFPPELMEYESPPGTYFDAFPLLVMSEAGLERLRTKAPDSAFDVRRFRPNLVVAGTSSDSPFPEFDWVGQKLRIGEATVSIEMACPRCVMTTHAFADLPKDPTIMRTLVREAGGNLGVYATIATPGRLRVGDAVERIA